MKKPLASGEPLSKTVDPVEPHGCCLLRFLAAREKMSILPLPRTVESGSNQRFYRIYRLDKAVGSPQVTLRFKQKEVRMD